jgi:hypothetical protein
MLNRKELFHRDLSEQNVEAPQNAPIGADANDNPQNRSSNSRNSNNSGSDNGQRAITTIGLSVRINENVSNRVPNRQPHAVDRVSTSQGNRRAPIQSKTVKRVQGKAFAIMNNMEVKV